MLKSIVLATLVLGAGPALADEVIIHRDAPAVEVVPPPPADVVIEKRVPDCRTSRTQTDDEVTGESTTVTRRRCD